MDVEDEFVRELITKENLIARQEQQLAEQGKQIAEKDGQLAEQGKQIAEKDRKLAATIELLKSLGLSDEEIAKKLNE